MTFSIHEQNAARHQARGDAYAAAGNLEYAKCSWAKAERNRAKDRALRAALAGPEPQTELERLVVERVNEARKRLAKSMLEALYAE